MTLQLWKRTRFCLLPLGGSKTQQNPSWLLFWNKLARNLHQSKDNTRLLTPRLWKIPNFTGITYKGFTQMQTMIFKTILRFAYIKIFRHRQFNNTGYDWRTSGRRIQSSANGERFKKHFEKTFPPFPHLIFYHFVKVTVIIRGPSCKSTWTMQLRHLPLHKAGDKLSLSNLGRPLAMEDNTARPSVQPSFFPDTVDKIPLCNACVEPEYESLSLKN